MTCRQRANNNSSNQAKKQTKRGNKQANTQTDNQTNRQEGTSVWIKRGVKRKPPVERLCPVTGLTTATKGRRCGINCSQKTMESQNPALFLWTLR